MVKLEICADGLASALIAEKAGAERIELCANLESGGLTPSHGMLRKVRDGVKIPVHVLIRPRRGDYVYNQQYLDVMLHDINHIRMLGFEGVVIGALNHNGELAVDQLKEMITAANEMSITFHRAIDVAADPFKVIGQLITLGVHRLLTSGNRLTAWEGRMQIQKYQQLFGSDISIMAGSGVNSNNIIPLLHSTGVTEVHASAKKLVQYTKNHSPLPELVEEDWYYESDFQEIKEMLSVLKKA